MLKKIIKSLDDGWWLPLLVMVALVAGLDNIAGVLYLRVTLMVLLIPLVAYTLLVINREFRKFGQHYQHTDLNNPGRLTEQQQRIRIISWLVGSVLFIISIVWFIVSPGQDPVVLLIVAVLAFASAITPGDLKRFMNRWKS